ncbi:MAG TPA: Ig-like domain-containing protein [Steroidobacteraceae bacterium]|nr:Ig-like domain-containing protein [Steroidobacteraceae bacterium]
MRAVRRFRSTVIGATVLLCVTSCGGGSGGPGGPALTHTAYSTVENIALNGTLTASDPSGGTVTFALGSQPQSGTISGFTSAGQFVYTPNRNFAGSDSFSVTASDSAGQATTGMISITVSVDVAPTTSDTVVRADPNSSGVSSVNVLANVTYADPSKLTVTVTPNSTLVGTATVTSTGEVSIAGLTGFKGITRFDYTLSDPSGKTATGHAAVFVGADPVKAAFVADATGSGSYEVYITDFAGAPTAVTAATQGNQRLQAFAISDNGATLVYRAQNTTNAAQSSLAFVQTAKLGTQTAIALPDGAVPVLSPSGKDQFIVSPDGNWIAVIAGPPGQSSTSSLYVLNVSNPTVVTPIVPAGTVYATQPTFSQNSANLYFLATGVTGGAAKSLYVAALSNPSVAALVSTASNPAKSDDIYAYSVASDQSRIAEEANRNGGVGLFYIDPAHLQVEIPINQPLAFAQSITSSTVGLAPGLGGSPDLERVAYTVENPPNPPTSDVGGVWVADVSATPDPTSVARLDQTTGIRPDDDAVMYTDGAQIFEALIGSTNPGQPLGPGIAGWYDSTGNIVLLQAPRSAGMPLASGSLLYSTVRGSFGATQQVGTPSMVTYYLDVSGFPATAAAIIGQGAASGTPPGSVVLSIVNALAPTAAYPMSTFTSPLQLTSDVSKVVSP